MNNPLRFTITPISGNHKNKSNIDYYEIEGLGRWMWDDSSHNSTQKGDLFAFYFTKHKNRPQLEQKFVFHRVEEVLNPSHRLPSWSSNVGQTNRNVLILSPPIFSILLQEWKNKGGPMSHMATYQPKITPLFLVNRYNNYLQDQEWQAIDNIPNMQQNDNFDWKLFDITQSI